MQEETLRKKDQENTKEGEEEVSPVDRYLYILLALGLECSGTPPLCNDTFFPFPPDLLFGDI